MWWSCMSRSAQMILPSAVCWTLLIRSVFTHNTSLLGSVAYRCVSNDVYSVLLLKLQAPQNQQTYLKVLAWCILFVVFVTQLPMCRQDLVHTILVCFW